MSEHRRPVMQISSVTLPKTVLFASPDTDAPFLGMLAAAWGELPRASSAAEVEGALQGGVRLVIAHELNWRLLPPRVLSLLQERAQAHELQVVVFGEGARRREELPPPVHLLLPTSSSSAEAEDAIYTLLTSQETVVPLAVPPVSGRRVVMVDDSELINRITRSVLSQVGYEVRCTTNPFELYRLIMEERPDLVLVDYNLPTLPGSQLIQVVRRAGMTVPLVLYSNAPEEVLARVTRECGASGYIRKGAGSHTLLTKLDQLFQQLVPAKGSGGSERPR